MSTAVVDADGVIQPDHVYSLDAFRRATGWGTLALRRARAKGLPVRKVGRRCFVVGRDFLDFVVEHGAPVGQFGPVQEQTE